MSTSYHKCEDRFAYGSKGQFMCRRAKETYMMVILASVYAALVGLFLVGMILINSWLDVAAVLVFPIPLAIITLLAVLLLFDFFSLKRDTIVRISEMKPVLRWTVYVVFLLLMLYLLPTNPSGQFIYFQF